MGKGGDKSQSEPYTRCQKCGVCEWNSLLLQRDRRCKCGAQLALHKPRKGGGKGQAPDLSLSLNPSAAPSDILLKALE
eukprot:4060048-Pyramimonas_sp.AAC.1